MSETGTERDIKRGREGGGRERKRNGEGERGNWLSSVGAAHYNGGKVAPGCPEKPILSETSADNTCLSSYETNALYDFAAHNFPFFILTVWRACNEIVLSPKPTVT